MIGIGKLVMNLMFPLKPPKGITISTFTGFVDHDRPVHQIILTSSANLEFGLG